MLHCNCIKVLASPQGQEGEFLQNLPSGVGSTGRLLFEKLIKYQKYFDTLSRFFGIRYLEKQGRPGICPAVAAKSGKKQNYEIIVFTKRKESHLFCFYILICFGGQKVASSNTGVVVACCNEPPRSRTTEYQTPNFFLVCHAAKLRGINPKRLKFCPPTREILSPPLECL